MKYDVCLEMVFTDLPYDARIAKIAACGFDLIEFWFHDGTFDGRDCAGGAKDAKVLKNACAAAGVTINNMVVNAPDGSHREGQPGLPSRQSESPSDPVRTRAGTAKRVARGARGGTPASFFRRVPQPGKELRT